MAALSSRIEARFSSHAFLKEWLKGLQQCLSPEKKRKMQLWRLLGIWGYSNDWLHTKDKKMDEQRGKGVLCGFRRTEAHLWFNDSVGINVVFNDFVQNASLNGPQEYQEGERRSKLSAEDTKEPDCSYCIRADSSPGLTPFLWKPVSILS